MTRELYESVMGKFLDAAGVTHFTARELCQVGRETKGKDGKVVRLQAPPVKLLRNMIETAQVAQWLREQVGPLTVLSGYRDDAYNRAVGGEDFSLHLEFNALDLTAKNATPQQLANLAAQHAFARRMGIGCYPTFVHVDCRGFLGRVAPARWPQPEWKSNPVRRAA